MKTLIKKNKKYYKVKRNLFFHEITFCKITGNVLHENKPIIDNKWCNKEIPFKTIVNICDIFSIELKQSDTLSKLDDAYDLLYNEYVLNKLSRTEIKEKYNIKCDIRNLLLNVGVSFRTVKESINNAFQTGRSTISEKNNQYNTGYHIDWDDIEHYYRSSYELEYYKKLDLLKISYETEKYHFTYYDTQLNQMRTAIPDIVIKETNTIYEIKSWWTYNQKEMEDKLKSYKENGYNFKLILENQEYEYAINDKPKNSYNYKNKFGPYKGALLEG